MLLRQIFSYMAKKALSLALDPPVDAYELLKRTDIIPIVLEKSGYMEAFSRTTNYKGNRMDIEPHKFFSKSDGSWTRNSCTRSGPW